MRLRKLGAVLLLLMLAGIAVVPLACAETVTLNSLLKSKKNISELPSKKTLTELNLSKEYLDYLNAPAILQSDKDRFTQLIPNSMGFEKFKDYSHGPVTVVWAYPYTGTQRMSTVIGSEQSDVYGLYYAYYDPKSDSLVDDGFVNWKRYW
jgi:hypothetical protein